MAGSGVARSVVVVARGEADQKLVDDAASHIRKTLQQTVYKGVVEVGNYLLKTFFGDDPMRARSRDPHKAASFHALEERCATGELPVSRTWLQNAVRLAAMSRQIGPDKSAFYQLEQSHQIALLPLGEPAKVVRFAERVVAKELSVRDLKAQVARERDRSADPSQSRGRASVPVINKSLDRALKVLTSEDGRRSFSIADVAALDEHQAERAAKTAKELIERLGQLVARLEKRA